MEAVDNKNYSALYSSKVFKLITKCCNWDNTICLPKDTKVFRARIVDTEDLVKSNNGIRIKDDGTLSGYDWINSKEPALGLASAGRANWQYASYFYCSENGRTAASELKPNMGDYISVATFNIKRDFKLVNLSNTSALKLNTIDAGCMQFIEKAFSTPVKFADDYQYTQFISDEVRKLGIDGICYKSYFTGTNNYVIFNCSIENIHFERSRILKLVAQSLDFIDYNTEVLLSTQEEQHFNQADILTEKARLFLMMEKYQQINAINKENNGHP
jgi:hypothetical protein